MKLCSLRIRNLRCIEEVLFRPRDYTCLIGPNNSGKSSTLRGIELLLNQEKPEIDEWRKGAEEEPIVVEAEFGTPTEWERRTPGVAALVYDEKIRIRMSATIVSDAKGKKVEVEWESFRREEQIDGWPEDASFTKLSRDLQDLAKEVGIDTKKFKQANVSESLRAAIREKRPNLIRASEPKWTRDGISIPAALKQALPQAQVIPAVRDASEDGKFGAKTSFGLLIKSIVLPAITCSPEYKEMMQAAALLRKTLRGDGTDKLAAVKEVETLITNRLSDLIAASVKLDLEAPDGEKFVGANTVLRLDDGTDTRIALQGHGLQRSLIFALLEVLSIQNARVPTTGGEDSKSRCTVLLFEEPELFIHPHLLRRLIRALTDISKKPDWQVITSTHSPIMVDVATDPLSLVIHTREVAGGAPRVKQLECDPFESEEVFDDRERLRAVIDFHPTVCEAFFAKHALLVEGDTEVAVLGGATPLKNLVPGAAKASQDVTVVSCDGKWTIAPIAKLLRAFGIPVRVIHDKDLKGRTIEEATASPLDEYNANSRIAGIVDSEDLFVVDDTFEHVLWEGGAAPVSKKDKPYRAWKRVRELCSEKTDLNHAPRLKAIIEFAFRLPDEGRKEVNAGVEAAEEGPKYAPQCAP